MSAREPVQLEVLLACIRQGDAEAMSQLLDRLQPDLLRYARRSCASADVDEAVQDAMWIIYRKAGALKFALAWSSWIFKIVLRICLRLKRQTSVLESFDDDNPEHMAGTTDVNMDLRLDLARILSHLEERHREVLLLHDFLGYTAEEAARALAISPQASKSRLHRARALVRQNLKELKYGIRQ
ncbi:MAG TPA: RNA polymerase sigma factor [Burkholderiaceae bacterium]|jgi:RNA polymerase sigma-70 factor (ECF subfamily)